MQSTNETREETRSGSFENTEVMGELASHEKDDHRIKLRTKHRVVSCRCGRPIESASAFQLYLETNGEEERESGGQTDEPEEVSVCHDMRSPHIVWSYFMIQDASTWLTIPRGEKECFSH